MKSIMQLSLSLSLFVAIIGTCIVAISETIPPGNGTGLGLGVLTFALAFMVAYLILNDEYEQ